MSDDVISQMIRWGVTNNTKQGWEFLDRNRQVFGWDDNDIEAHEHLVEPEVAPFIPAELPGIELKENYATPPPAVEEFNEEGYSFSQATATVAANANLDDVLQGPDMPIIILNEDDDDNHPTIEVQPQSNLSLQDVVTDLESDDDDNSRAGVEVLHGIDRFKVYLNTNSDAISSYKKVNNENVTQAHKTMSRQIAKSPSW